MQITSDLNNLKQFVGYYELTKDRLPKSLEEAFLTYPYLIKIQPIDPITNKPYYYEILDDGKNFRICFGFGTTQEKCVTGSEQ